MSKPLQAKFNATLEDLSLLEIVDECLSARQVLSRLGYGPKGQYALLLRQFLKDNDIDHSHWTPNGIPRNRPVQKNCANCGNIFEYRVRSDKKEQMNCSKSCANSFFRRAENNPNWIDGAATYRKRALYHYGNKCIKCGYSNVDALEVHHKDENRENNDIDNLEVLCANCHTLTHKGKL